MESRVLFAPAYLQYVSAREGLVTDIEWNLQWPVTLNDPECCARLAMQLQWSIKLADSS